MLFLIKMKVKQRKERIFFVKGFWCFGKFWIRTNIQKIWRNIHKSWDPSVFMDNQQYGTMLFQRTKILCWQNYLRFLKFFFWYGKGCFTRLVQILGVFPYIHSMGIFFIFSPEFIYAFHLFKKCNKKKSFLKFSGNFSKFLSPIDLIDLNMNMYS